MHVCASMYVWKCTCVEKKKKGGGGVVYSELVGGVIKICCFFYVNGSIGYSGSSEKYLS